MNSSLKCTGNDSLIYTNDYEKVTFYINNLSLFFLTN